MTVSGIGVDIAKIDRVGHLLRHPKRAMRWVLHPDEVRYYMRRRNRTEWLARFFSAKEAVFKSLGLTNFGAAGFRLIRISFADSSTGSAVLFGHLRDHSRGQIRKIYISSVRLKQHVISQAISLK